MHKLFFLCLLLLASSSLSAQSPYQLNTKKEAIILGAGIASTSAGVYFRAQTPSFTSQELELLNTQDINAFDRVATKHFSLKAHGVSNYFWYGSQALPFLLLAGEASRKELPKLIVLYGETALLTSGLTLLTKYTVRRPRPFNYDPNTSLAKKTASNAKASFFSGHTSITATNSFFVAKVFSDYYPNSKWKPIVWTAAAAIPAITGYLRVRGGRHFPSDVIGGYIVGAAVGYLVPHLHRRTKQAKPLTIHAGFNRVYVGVAF